MGINFPHTYFLAKAIVTDNLIAMAKHQLFVNAKVNGATTRTETLNGEEYLVVPAIPMKEGVMNGIFYPKAEIQAFPEAWNGSPSLHQSSYR